MGGCQHAPGHTKTLPVMQTIDPTESAFLILRDIELGLSAPTAEKSGFALTMARGESVAVLDREGKAARAVLRMISGFLRPPRGDIIFNGRRLVATPPHRRGFGYVPANAALTGFRDIASNVAAPLAAHGLSGKARRARVAAMLAMVGLAECAARRPGDLSPAERYRAALARALIASPALLLLEEPDDGFAEPERRMLATLLRGGPAAPGVTTLLAARTPATVFALADRALVLEQGGIAQDAAPQTLYDAPASLAVASAMGEANILEGVLEEDDNDIARIRLDNGARVAGSLAERVTIGQRSRLMIRPERVAVAAIAAEELGEGAISAVLRKIIPLGALTRLVVSLGAGGEIIITRPASSNLRGMQPGLEMSVAWSAAHARIFAAGPQEKL